MLTVAEVFDKIVDHKGHVDPIRNEVTGQRGVRVRAIEYGREQVWEFWFPTDVLNASNGPIVTAMRSVAEMLSDMHPPSVCGGAGGQRRILGPTNGEVRSSH